MKLLNKLVLVASASGAAGLQIVPGSAPSAPTNGDLWATSSGLFTQVNGATKTVAFADTTQPLDATLTALAGLTWSAGTQVPVMTAADTFSLKTVGSATGNLLDKAAGDALYASLTGSNTYSGLQTITSSGATLWSSGAGRSPTGIQQSVVNTSATTGSLSGLSLQVTSGGATLQHAQIAAVSSASGYTPNIVFGAANSSTTYTEWARFDTAGKLGIGTTAPARLLHVNGNAQFGDLSTTDGSVFVYGTSESTPSLQVSGGGNTAALYPYGLVGARAGFELSNSNIGGNLTFKVSAAAARDTTVGTITSTGLAITGTITQNGKGVLADTTYTGAVSVGAGQGGRFLLDPLTNNVFQNYANRFTVIDTGSTNFGSIDAGTTFVRELDIPASEINGTNVTYADGWLVIPFYSGSGPASISVRVWDNSTGVWRGPFASSTNIGLTTWPVYVANITGVNWMTKVEVTVVAQAGVIAKPLDIQYFPARDIASYLFPLPYMVQGANQVQFGGGKSTHVRLKRVNTQLQVRLGDDSGDADLSARDITASANMTSPGLNLSGAAGSFRQVYFQTGGVNRFFVGVDNAAENGNNNGSNFEIYRYSDTGTNLGASITISRATGNVTAGAGLDAAGTIRATNRVNPTTGQGLELVFDPTGGTGSLGAGNIFSYDRTNSAYRDLVIGASKINLRSGSSDIVVVTSTGAAVTGSLSATGALSASNFSGSSSGVNTGDGATWNLNIKAQPSLTELQDEFNYPDVATLQTKWSINVPSNVSIVTTTDTGGKAIQIGDNSGNDTVTGIMLQTLPYIPTETYEIIYDFEVVAAGASTTLYLGVQGLDAAGNNLGSSYNYIVYSGVSESAILGRQVRRAYFKGTGPVAAGSTGSTPDAPTTLPDGSKFAFGQGGVAKVAPMFLANYNGAPGQVIIHSVTLRRIHDWTLDIANRPAGLLSLANQSWTSGTQVPVLTAANTYSLKTVGSATGNLLDRASGDTLYASLTGGNSFTGGQTITSSGASDALIVSGGSVPFTLNSTNNAYLMSLKQAGIVASYIGAGVGYLFRIANSAVGDRFTVTDTATAVTGSFSATGTITGSNLSGVNTGDGADWPTNITNRPANLIALTGTEKIKNTDIVAGGFNYCTDPSFENGVPTLTHRSDGGTSTLFALSTAPVDGSTCIGIGMVGSHYFAFTGTAQFVAKATSATVSVYARDAGVTNTVREGWSGGGASNLCVQLNMGLYDVTNSVWDAGSGSVTNTIPYVGSRGPWARYTATITGLTIGTTYAVQMMPSPYVGEEAIDIDCIQVEDGNQASAFTTTQPKSSPAFTGTTTVANLTGTGNIDFRRSDSATSILSLGNAGSGTTTQIDFYGAGGANIGRIKNLYNGSGTVTQTFSGWGGGGLRDLFFADYSTGMVIVAGTSTAALTIKGGKTLVLNNSTDTVSASLSFDGANLVSNRPYYVSGAGAISILDALTGQDARFDLRQNGTQIGSLGVAADGSGVNITAPFGKTLNLVIAATTRLAANGVGVAVTGDLTVSGNVNATNITTLTNQFTGRNDRSNAAVPSVTFSTDGSDIDHDVNKNGSVNINLKWHWAGDETTIDGFIVTVAPRYSGPAREFFG